LEAKDFRLSRSKMEYMKYDFSATKQEEGDANQERHLSLLEIDALKGW
jgi:hypothetical protein